MCSCMCFVFMLFSMLSANIESSIESFDNIKVVISKEPFGKNSTIKADYKKWALT